MAFVSVPLFTATSLLLQQSTIQAFEKKKQGICLYSALIGHPATGKSIACDFIKDAMVKLEENLAIPCQMSCMTNSASIEGLLHHLSKISCMIGKY